MDRRMFMKSSISAAALARLGLTAEPAEPAADLAPACNSFALDLFARLRAKEGNQFSSPFSIGTALAMTELGAAGNTLKQMCQVLHFPENPERFHLRLGELLKRLNGDGKDRGYQLAVANALWGARGYGFRPEFLARARDVYGAGLTELDFAASAEKARLSINAWVEEHTQKRIKDLMPSGSVGADTRLVLTNAIYFKGNWASQFDKKATRVEVFHTSAEKSVRAPLMHRTGAYGYFDNDELQALAIPYRGRELSMVFMLPRRKHALAELEKSLTADKLQRWLTALHESDVIVTLPRFKMTSEYSLVPALREMGMRDAFTVAADFSGMSSREGLMISDVVHKAFVEVNEEGAEAAGATGVAIKPTAIRGGPVRHVPVFRADEPFLFLIRDNQSGCVLFLGRVSSPE
jgi:serpin B